MVKKCNTYHKVKSTSKFNTRRLRKSLVFRIAFNCRECAKNHCDIKRRELLKAYGNGKCACVCCGEHHLEFLTIDHIGGMKTRVLLGHAIKKDMPKGSRSLSILLQKQGYPHKDKLRTLCMNCNMATRWNRICPHQRSKHEKAI